MPLDKSSPVPLYYQLAETLREQIRQGELRPGDQLPSERQLSDQYVISRMTARQAIAHLVREGAVVARHGLGTFVAEPKITYDALHLLGFTEEMLRHGVTASSRVLDQARVLPSPRIAERLGLPAGGAATKIVRLRSMGPVPLLLETTFVPETLCPGLETEDLASQSLYSVMERRYGIRPQRARQTLEATVADQHEARLLGVASGSAMILLEGVTYDARERPVELFKAVYRGDRVTFEFASERGAWVPLPDAPRADAALADQGRDARRPVAASDV